MWPQETCNSACQIVTWWTCWNWVLDSWEECDFSTYWTDIKANPCYNFYEAAENWKKACTFKDISINVYKNVYIQDLKNNPTFATIPKTNSKIQCNIPINSDYWVKTCLSNIITLTISNYLYNQWNYDLLNLSTNDKTYK